MNDFLQEIETDTSARLRADELDKHMGLSEVLAGRQKTGATALHFAAGGRHAAVVKVLLEYGARFAAKDENWYTPLHYAAIWNGQTETTAFLIANGAEVNAVDNDGNTSLALARERLFDALAELLRAHGGRVKAP